MIREVNFVAQLLRHTKYFTICMMATVRIHSLNLKSQIHMDISLQLKQNYQEPALDKKNFSLQIANLWNSLPENVVEAPSTDMFKS